MHNVSLEHIQHQPVFCSTSHSVKAKKAVLVSGYSFSRISCFPGLRLRTCTFLLALRGFFSAFQVLDRLLGRTGKSDDFCKTLPGCSFPFRAWSFAALRLSYTMFFPSAAHRSLHQEARRRRQSVIFADTVEASESRRRASLPISFGHNGKPALSRINTFGL